MLTRARRRGCKEGVRWQNPMHRRVRSAVWTISCARGARKLFLVRAAPTTSSARVVLVSASSVVRRLSIAITNSITGVMAVVLDPAQSALGTRSSTTGSTTIRSPTSFRSAVFMGPFYTSTETMSIWERRTRTTQTFVGRHSTTSTFSSTTTAESTHRNPQGAPSPAATSMLQCKRL